MKKFWKIVLWTLLGLIAALISAVHIVLYTPLKDRLISNVAEPLLEGELSVRKVRVSLLRTFPDFGLSVNDISLTYPTAADTVVGVSHIGARLHLPSLFQGCIDVRQAVLEGLLVDFEMSDTLMLKPQPPKNDTVSEKSASIPCFKADFTLSDTRLSALGLVRDASLEFALQAQNSKDGVLDANLSGLCLRALGADFDANVSGHDLLGDDPQISVDADAMARLQGLAQFFPKDISADGDVALALNGVLARSGANAVARISSGRLRAKTPYGRFFLSDVRVEAGAHQGAEKLPPRPRRHFGGELPDYLADTTFRARDIDVKIDTSITSLISEWNPSGSIHVGRGRVIMPQLPLRTTLGGFDAHFDVNQLSIDTLALKSGTSDISAVGSLKGFRRMLTGKGRGFYRLKLDLTSDRLNLNELLAALDEGLAKTSALDTLSDDAYMESITRDDLSQVQEAEPMKLFVVPANMKADLHVHAKEVDYSTLVAHDVNAKVEVKERTVLVTELGAKTEAGTLNADAFYSTRTVDNIGAGFNLSLHNITADKVIDLIPAVDTLVPMLKTFKGNLNCELAATTKLDTSFTIQSPSLNGAFRITGSGLSLDQEGDFKKVAKLLLFHDRKKGQIDTLFIGGVVTDNKVRVFPFKLALDRYSLSLGGTQKFDGGFNYKVSLLRSPLPFRFGVRLHGRDFDHLKWGFIKAQFRESDVPKFDGEVESMLKTQRRSIRGVLGSGSDSALRKGREMARILSSRADDMKRIDSYEELPADHVSKIDSLSASPAALDSLVNPVALPDSLVSSVEIPDSLQTQTAIEQ